MKMIGIEMICEGLGSLADSDRIKFTPIIPAPFASGKYMTVNLGVAES
jgi:hypothetical protein